MSRHNIFSIVLYLYILLDYIFYRGLYFIEDYIFYRGLYFNKNKNKNNDQIRNNLKTEMDTLYKLLEENE